MKGTRLETLTREGSAKEGLQQPLPSPSPVCMLVTSVLFLSRVSSFWSSAPDPFKMVLGFINTDKHFQETGIARESHIQFHLRTKLQMQKQENATK